MIVRSQDGLLLIQCKNVILEGTYNPRNSARISEISRSRRDFTLGMYSSVGQAYKVMNEIQSAIEKDNRLLIDANGNIVDRLHIETIYVMPKDEALSAPQTEHRQADELQR